VARLFVALELPAEIRTALARWGASLAAVDVALRALAAESLHVTLTRDPLPPVPAVGVFTATGVTLFRSHPGSVYESLSP
jgi:hypothetical protein